MLTSPRARLAGSLAAVAALAIVGAGAGATATSAASSTATGRVFFNNPVQSTGDETLTDQKDSDAAVPAAAYRTVTLTNLDGSGRLVGDYANVVSSTGDAAIAPDGKFLYTRRDDRFEQVMAYYWVTEAQKYIQGLGFTGAQGALPAVNRESQDVRINQSGSTTRSPGTRRTCCGSARVASTTPRTARSSSTSTATPYMTPRSPASAARWTPVRSARRSVTTLR